MAIRKIARMGHDVLKARSTSVPDPTADHIKLLAQDLIDTCEDINGNGIAAPQIYEGVRMFVYRVRKSSMPQDAQMDEIPWTVCVNPELEVLSDRKELCLERCLSIPGLCGLVPRPSRIRFRWTDLEGTQHSIIAFNHHARLLEHEFDHLDGILYPMRMDDVSTLAFVNELGPPPSLELPRSSNDFVNPEIE